MFALGNRCGDIGIAGIPVPQQLTGQNVEGADNARLFLSREIIIHGAADNNLAVNRGWRRGGIIIAGRIIFHATGQIEHAFVGKALADLAGLGIQCNQMRIRCRQITRS